MTSSGPKSTILKFRYVLLNRPFLHKILNETDILKASERAGFKTVVFTDGYNQSASYSLPLKD